MERLYGRFRERGLVVVAISVDADGEAAVVPFVKRQGFTFPVALDPRRRIADAYAVRGLPSTVLLDRSGRVVARAFGPREWDGPPAQALIEGLLGLP